MDVFSEVSAFYESYRGKKTVYGYSEEGRPLYAMLLGEERGAGVSQYAIHGREYITALLALGHIGRGVESGGVWVLPLTNPDGALISEAGIETVSPARRKFVLGLGGDLRLWKANADGVDLNVNFPARFGTGTANVFSPAPENYVGKAPLSAKESRALAEFTLSVSPAFTVSWHTKGEEIYWRFHQPPARAARDKKLARVLSKSTGYPLAEAKGSAGGYKDWCVETLRIPAFTVEVGENSLKHPVGRASLGGIVKRTENALAALTAGRG